MQYKFNKSTIVVPKQYTENKAVFDVINRLGIKAGSAIAMVENEHCMRLYYEGNINGAENLHDYNERILCAAGRAMTAYPTIAFMVIQRAEYDQLFAEVGNVTVMEKKMVIQISDTDAALKWSSTYVRPF